MSTLIQQQAEQYPPVEYTAEPEVERQGIPPHHHVEEGEMRHQLIKGVHVTRQEHGELSFIIEPSIENEEFEHPNIYQKTAVTHAPSRSKLVVGELSVTESIQNVRKYSDFVLLRRLLREKYPQCIVPPIPSSANPLVDVQLELFLSRVLAHPILADDAFVHEFIFSEQWSTIHKHEHESKGVGKVLNEALAPVKKAITDAARGERQKDNEEKRFLSVRSILRKQANTLLQVQKDIVYIARAQRDLARHYLLLGENLEQLSIHEPTLREPLEAFAHGSKQMSKAYEENSNKHVDADIASYQQFAVAGVETLDYHLYLAREKHKVISSLHHHQDELQRLRNKSAEESGGKKFPFVKTTGEKIQKQERHEEMNEEKLENLESKIQLANSCLPAEIQRFETWKWRDFLRLWRQEVDAGADVSRAFTRASIDVLSKLDKFDEEELHIEPWWETSSTPVDTDDNEELEHSVTEERVGME